MKLYFCLKPLMEHRKLSAYALAKQSGISVNSVYNMLRDDFDVERLTIGTIYKLCKVLNCPIEKLVMNPDVIDKRSNERSDLFDNEIDE